VQAGRSSKQLSHRVQKKILAEVLPTRIAPASPSTTKPTTLAHIAHLQSTPNGPPNPLPQRPARPPLNSDLLSYHPLNLPRPPIHPPTNPARNPATASQTSLHLHATDHTIRRQHIPASDDEPSARVPVDKRYAQHAAVESELA
jgi:hypothetical protein